jgi:hypothetical protein
MHNPTPTAASLATLSKANGKFFADKFFHERHLQSFAGESSGTEKIAWMVFKLRKMDR